MALRPSLLGVFAALLSAWPAAAGQVAVVLSGTSFNGGPGFELAIDKQVVGTGTVDPVPPAGQGEEFVFDVPDQLLVPGAPLSLRLTNDAFDGPGRDRNLYVLSAQVNGQTLPATAFQVISAGQPVAHRLRSGHVEVWSGRELATASLPEGSIVSLAGPPAPSAPADKPACDAHVEVAGFSAHATALTPDQMAALAPALAESKKAPCAISVVGYSSRGGGADANQKVSKIRAELVLAALEAQGAQFAASQVVAGGSTDKFGAEPAANQRVVVTLSAAN